MACTCKVCDETEKTEDWKMSAALSAYGCSALKTSPFIQDDFLLDQRIYLWSSGLTARKNDLWKTLGESTRCTGPAGDRKLETVISVQGVATYCLSLNRYLCRETALSAGIRFTSRRTLCYHDSISAGGFQGFFRPDKQLSDHQGPVRTWTLGHWQLKHYGQSKRGGELDA